VVLIRRKLGMGGLIKLTDTREGTFNTEAGEERGDASRRVIAVRADEICEETSNVRSGHRSSRDSVGAAVVPSRGNANTGCKDVNDRAEVGERGNGVSNVGCTDGVGNTNTSGGG
jgi:hypothetical protein